MSARLLTKQLASALLASLLLAGCATVNPDTTFASVNRDAATFTQGELALARSNEQRLAMRDAADGLLGQPLTQDAAVRVALLNSPELQAALAAHWAEAADAAQRGRIANPVLTVERLRSASEIELGRMLAFGLLDLLSLPQRQRMAEATLVQSRLQLTARVVERITRVRQAWVSAVADAQRTDYAQQVHDSAEASAELARRMLAAGNFNKLQRARQQAFYADAAAQWAAAAHTRVASREALVRLLGLSDAQAERLRLPDRLPELPGEPLSAAAVAATASTTRLDLQIATAELDAETLARGLGRISSVTDIELSLIDNVTRERSDGHRLRSRGAEVALRLPLFDSGDLLRDAGNARVLAAANRLDASVRSAGSQLREVYSAYRTSHDIARHYRAEIVPLRKQISEENLLRYNGMLIGVFELLADSRDQIASVSAAIDAQRQFWLADAELQSTLIGHPLSSGVALGASVVPRGGDDGKH